MSHVPLLAETIQLAQGLTLIHQYIPTTPVVVVDVWVQAGARVEPQKWEGIAHFLEHMIFKGSRRVAPGVFDYVVEGRGGKSNAGTAHDYAHFYMMTAIDHLPETLPYLADILLDAVIDEEEFFREREVVIDEIRGCYDDPDWIGFQNLSQQLYQVHPYGRSVLGDEETLMQMTPNQMRCFHRTFYQPEKMTVVMVGGVDRTTAIALVQDTFGEFNTRSECPPISIDAEPPLVEIRRSISHVPQLGQARLSLGWIGPGVDQFSSALGLDMLSVILAGGRTSRLVQELREEKQLVFDIGSSFSLQKDSSLFTISTWLDPTHLTSVEAMIQDHIAQLQHKLMKEEELMRCQKFLTNDYIFSSESPIQLAGLYGYYHTIADVNLSAQYPHQLKQVSTHDLQQIATCYLSPTAYGVSILSPS